MTPRAFAADDGTVSEKVIEKLSALHKHECQHVRLTSPMTRLGQVIGKRLERWATRRAANLGLLTPVDRTFGNGKDYLTVSVFERNDYLQICFAECATGYVSTIDPSIDVISFKYFQSNLVQQHTRPLM